MKDLKSIITDTDSYKASHFLQYPEGAQYVTSYIEARGSNDSEFERQIVAFGVQAYIKKNLLTPITMEQVEFAQELFEAHGEPFNYEGWKRIVEVHNGYLPIEIEAVPEGLVLPLKNVLVQVTNTDPQLPWLTSYIETSLLRAIWYPSTVATNSFIIKQKLTDYAVKSGSDLNGLPFKLHDFGSRGVSSEESSALGGLGHLLNFMGTDTIGAILAGREFYGENMAGFSIPAAEHSTITSWGQENEVAAYRNMIRRFGVKNAIFAVVSDSYDIYNATDNIWGAELKDEVINSGATLVVRPDSGDPTTMPVEVILRLMNQFGFDTNEKGYKTLPACVRVIQGDGIDKDSIEAILGNLDSNKLTLDNIAFGMGGALLQGVNRDTMKFAMKANEIVINGERRAVMKNPVTDSGKKSKAGAQELILKPDGTYVTVPRTIPVKGEKILRTVYKNGELLVDDDLTTIRARAQAGIKVTATEDKEIQATA